MAEPDGTIASAWYFNSAHDGSERVAYNQIVSAAVAKLQNIGDYCVWLTRNGEAEVANELDREYAVADARYAAEQTRSEARKQYLDTLIPAAWHDELSDRDTWEQWCLDYAYHGEKWLWETVQHVQGWNPLSRDKKGILAAMDSYLTEIAQEGVTVGTAAGSDAPTRLDGCGKDRPSGSTYRWTTDGTHLFAADDRTVPADRTYWTDAGGFLVGRPKGGAGQSWTIAPWSPPSTSDNRTGAILGTGLFGPLGGLMGL
ncbi:hypothetical protein ACFYTQ_16315 [Nocardia sp. NPDC004068]|uniref:hypothetical protein n=1 Tax=Nocardia sp. NPDC004068 TaxID=3364303 RepID=UPI0036A236B2